MTLAVPTADSAKRSGATVTIASRFQGPDGSGNGGYTSGLLAGFLGARAQVTLRSPPPLERRLTVAAHDGGAVLRETACGSVPG